MNKLLMVCLVVLGMGGVAWARDTTFCDRCGKEIPDMREQVHYVVCDYCLKCALVVIQREIDRPSYNIIISSFTCNDNLIFEKYKDKDKTILAPMGVK